MFYYFLKNGLWIWHMPDWDQKNRFVILNCEQKKSSIRWIRYDKNKIIKSQWIDYGIENKKVLTITHAGQKSFFIKSSHRKHPLPSKIKIKATEFRA